MYVEIDFDNELKDLFVTCLKNTSPDIPIKCEDEDIFYAMRDTFIEKFVFEGDKWATSYDLTPTGISDYCYSAFTKDDNTFLIIDVIDQFIDFVCDCVLPKFTKIVAKCYRNRIQISQVDDE